MLIFKCDDIHTIYIDRKKQFHSSNKIEDGDTESIMFSSLIGYEKLKFTYDFKNKQFYVNLKFRDRNRVLKIQEEINKNEGYDILLSIDQFNYKINLKDDKYRNDIYLPGEFHFRNIDEFDYNIFILMKELIENKTFKTDSIGLYIIDNKNI